MRIDDSTIQKIKDEADIVQIISEYIQLEKKSSSYIGLCPFHPDQNPSLNVSPTKKIYKCFSCQAGGDVIKFIQDYEKVPFVKAVQIAGEKAGILVETSGDDIYQNQTKYYNILSTATRFYNFLLENTTDGVEAKEYLYKRKLNDGIIKRFNIGVAANEPDLLYKSLLEDNFQALDMLEAGVVRSGKSYYDIFRNRIIFPLDDVHGNIVGFSGRVYKESQKDEPKYYNSIENKVFKKGDILYNFSSAENQIRAKGNAFIFEGFMDVIAAYRANIHNTVAIMGTSLSRNQIKAIKKSTNKVVICYDGDSPGIEASKKSIIQLILEDFDVSAILLPEGSDPDDYLNKYGESKFADLLLNSQISGYDYLYESAKKSLNLDDLNSVEYFKNEVFNFLKYFNSSVLIEKFLDKLSIDIKVSLESLKSDFNKIPPLEQRRIPVADYPIEDLDIPGEFQKPRKKRKDKYNKASRELIRIAYGSKEYCFQIQAKLNNRFIDKLHNSLLAQITNYYKLNNEMNLDFKENLSEDELDLLTNILEHDIQFVDLSEEAINQCVKNINEFYRKSDYDKLLGEIKEDYEAPNIMEKINKAIKFKKDNIKIKE